MNEKAQCFLQLVITKNTLTEVFGLWQFLAEKVHFLRPLSHNSVLLWLAIKQSANVSIKACITFRLLQNKYCIFSAHFHSLSAVSNRLFGPFCKKVTNYLVPNNKRVWISLIFKHVTLVSERRWSSDLGLPNRF